MEFDFLAAHKEVVLEMQATMDGTKLRRSTSGWPTTTTLLLTRYPPENTIAMASSGKTTSSRPKNCRCCMNAGRHQKP